MAPFAQKILIYPNPRTGLEAKFSLPYCASVSWLDGWPGVGAFADSQLTRPDLVSLLGRVSVRDSSDDTECVTVVFADGGRDSERVSFARGTPEVPLTREERYSKVRSLVSPSLAAEGADALIAGVEGLEGFSRCADFVALLVPEKDS